MKSNDSLLNFGFLTLNALVLFAFFNIAVFFSFTSFLATLPIDQQWHGLLIGLIAASALIIRPIISTRLSPRNAIRGVAIGLVLIAVSLVLYSFAQTILPMALLRVAHGAGYVTLMSSCITLLMLFLPPKKSGQGFGIITIMTLLPYAVAPLILEHVLPTIPLNRIYAFTAALMIPAGLLLLPLNRLVKEHTSAMQGTPTSLPKGSLLKNLRQPKILCLLGANGLMIAVFALVFYFLKTFCAESGVGQSSLFFTTATAVMIGVRIFLGPFFDRYDKASLALIALGILLVALLVLNSAGSMTYFYLAAVLYGLGIGASAPLLNGLMFSLSEPLYRGLNTNLMLEMVDVGFFLGPVFCGVAITAGFSQSSILLSCSGVIAFAMILIGVIRKRTTTGSHDDA